MKYRLPNNYIVALLSFTGFIMLVLLVRNKVEGDNHYNFLLWNLFLAFLPLVFSWIIYFLTGKLNKGLIVICTLIWLLFYPNAPYMISDLIHVNFGSSMIVYDTLIIFLFAIVALFYGFYSLKLIHLVYKIIAGRRVANIVVWASIIISSAGFYLGRILRLNSWDLFTHPFMVMGKVIDHLFPLYKNPATYAIIFLFSTIQFIMLIMMKDMDEIEDRRLISGQLG